jgi:hypothetical protein
MATQMASPKVAPDLSSNIIRVLAQPWLDRKIAAVACVPISYGVYYRHTHFHQGLPLSHAHAPSDTTHIVQGIYIRLQDHGKGRLHSPPI